MICQKKNKRSLVFCLSFLLFCLAVIPCLFSVNSYASETSTESVEQYFRTHNFYDTAAFVCRKYASFPYLDYMTGSTSNITYDAWADWLESKGLSNLLQEDVTITGTGGGRGYDIPQDVRQEILNFVQNTYVEANPLSYTKCYIYSYSFLSPDLFPTYDQYASIKEYIKNQNGYCLLYPYRSGGTFQYLIATFYDRSDLNFVGTTSQGGFTNVHGYIGWTELTGSNFLATADKCVKVVSNGTISDLNSLPSISSYALYNTAMGNTANYGTYNKFYVFSNYSKNEMVYVFNSLNALKNYNANANEPYYMPSNSQTTVPYYDGFTQNDLNNAANFYNNIVVNSEGKTPNEILKTTDSVLGSLNLGGSDSESSSGGLFDSLGDIITGATGAISPIKEIVLGDIKDLVADVFDFLPPTIITLWVSGIIFGIFFGVLKLIRG